ncbi:MAG: hypothetical protein Q8898_13025, partial [Bacillota bacterium]|nr:hypothetical protein [Bacillota bacterium]
YQSVISLTYQNGYVYGGTTIFSGKDLEGKATAVLFRIRASQPTGKIEMLPIGIKYPRMIHALAVGPDNRIWGLSDGNLFAYDPVKKKAQSIKVVPNTSGRFRNGALASGKDGYIYGAVEKRLFRVNAKTMKLEFLTNVPAEDMTMDPSGRIYFSEHENLWRYQP